MSKEMKKYKIGKWYGCYKVARKDKSKGKTYYTVKDNYGEITILTNEELTKAISTKKAGVEK